MGQVCEKCSGQKSEGSETTPQGYYVPLSYYREKRDTYYTQLFDFNDEKKQNDRNIHYDRNSISSVVEEKTERNQQEEDEKRFQDEMEEAIHGKVEEISVPEGEEEEEGIEEEGEEEEEEEEDYIDFDADEKEEEEEGKEEKEEEKVKTRYDLDLEEFRKRQAERWRDQSSPTSPMGPIRGSPFSSRSSPTTRRGEATNRSLPDQEPESITRFHDRYDKPVTNVSGLREREVDPKRIGVECLIYTNEYRKTQGLRELKWNDHLHEIALPHSVNMGTKKVPVGHDGVNERFRKVMKKCGSKTSCENVYSTSSNVNVAKTAVDGWIKSEGHKKNLLSKSTYCAVAVYTNESGVFYLTQLFCGYGQNVLSSMYFDKNTQNF